jgi:hypothetical protein
MATVTLNRYVYVDKAELVHYLKRKPIQMQFVMDNGNPREMTGTLDLKNPDYNIPQELRTDAQIEEALTYAKQHPDQVRVWDLDSNGWRTVNVKRMLMSPQIRST